MILHQSLMTKIQRKSKNFIVENLNGLKKIIEKN